MSYNIYLFTLIKMKRFLILLAVVVLSSSQDWDRKAGRDWTNTQCLTGTQAPLKFSLADTKPLDKKYYFFPTTNKNEKEQSIFLIVFKKLLMKKIDETKLPIEISVDTFGDLMDGFSVFDGAYIYDAQLNFPPCDVSVNYVYIHRFLKISKTLLEQLKVCRKGDRIDKITGNARQASEDIPFFGIGVFQP